MSLLLIFLVRFRNDVGIGLAPARYPPSARGLRSLNSTEAVKVPEELTYPVSGELVHH